MESVGCQSVEERLVEESVGGYQSVEERLVYIAFQTRTRSKAIKTEVGTKNSLAISRHILAKLEEFYFGC